VQDVLLEAARVARYLASRRAGHVPEAPRDGVANAYGRGFVDALRRMLPEGAPGAQPRADGR